MPPARSPEPASPAAAAAAERRTALRRRDGSEARVTYEEIFFDLIYAFAVTQLSHYLLHALTPLGAMQSLVLWFAVWLGWQYTCWVTNWFNPQRLSIRLMLFVVMLFGLVMSAALPEAFADRGLLFAGAYAAMQVGRTIFVLINLGPGNALTPNFRRIFGWICIAAVLWLAGGLLEPTTRLWLWAGAVACEYISPMFGFWLPGLGRSSTQEWTIEGGHLAERCQAFVFVALGESIVASGATLSETADWTFPIVAAFVVTFLGSIALWWSYFDTSSTAGSEVITHSSDPGRIGAYFHYVHVIIIGGIIVAAVGADLVIAHPEETADHAHAAAILAGPVIYLIGNSLYKAVVYGWLPASHLAGLAAYLILAGLAALIGMPILGLGAAAAAILIVVATWEARSRRRK
jgi:low temperature requirement protein LtrA